MPLQGASTSLRESLARFGLPKVYGLRIHDPNDNPERPDGVDEVGVALGVGGMLERLREMRRSGTIERVSLGMNSNVVNPGTTVPGFALPPSLTHGVPAEIVRVIRGAPAGTFDEALLAGGWTLLDHTGLDALVECQKHGVKVAIAGIFNSGLLVGGTTFAYQEADSEQKKAAQRWRELASQHGLSLPAVAIAFAYLPTIVESVVIGMASADEVQKNVAAVEESRKVPAALWYEARSRGLLGPEVPLPPRA